MRDGSYCRVSEVVRQTRIGVQDKEFLLMFLLKCVSPVMFLKGLMKTFLLARFSDISTKSELATSKKNILVFYLKLFSS